MELCLIFSVSPLEFIHGMVVRELLGLQLPFASYWKGCTAILQLAGGNVEKGERNWPGIFLKQ